MGDMTSGGAPRAKSIVAHLTTLAGAITNGLMKATLRNSSGTEIGTADNPIYVDIGGNVPDSMNISQVGGTATAVGAGITDAGTLRVAVATDDVNLAGILAQLDITQSALRDALKGAGGKDLSTLETDIEAILAATDVALSTRATEATLAAQLDITQSALRDAIRGASTKDLTTLQTALDAVKTAVEKIDDVQDATVAEGAVPTKGIQVMLDDGTDTQFAQCDANGYLKTTLQTAVPAGTNEIGGVNQTKVAGTAVSVNSGVLDAGTQRVAIATDDVNLSAIKTAVEKIDDVQDATVAEGGTPTKGVQMLLDNGTTGQFVQGDASGNLNVNLQTAIPAGTNEIGGVDVVKVAGVAPSTAGKLDVLVADGDDAALGASTDVAVVAGAEGTLSAKLRLITSQVDAAVTALQAIDDWDSGDQCKVTPTAMGYTEANGDGTTADAYAAAVTIDMRAHNQLKLLLSNTDAANSLDYKVTCYAKHGGALSVDEVTEAAVVAGAVAEVTLTEKWAQVVVQVKSTVVDTPATYAYEYIQSVM